MPSNLFAYTAGAAYHTRPCAECFVDVRTIHHNAGSGIDGMTRVHSFLQNPVPGYFATLGKTRIFVKVHTMVLQLGKEGR